MKRAIAFRSVGRTFGLGLLAAAAIALPLAPSAFAVDTVISKNAPDLTKVRALIKAKDFKTAISELSKIADTTQHADVYNLLGFSYRKSGDLKTGGTFYAKALDFDPNHKGALEYQGEMFMELGQPDKAKVNLAKLVTLCPTGCEEREDLEKAIAAGGAAPTKTN